MGNAFARARTDSRLRALARGIGGRFAREILCSDVVKVRPIIKLCQHLGPRRYGPSIGLSFSKLQDGKCPGDLSAVGQFDPRLPDTQGLPGRREEMHTRHAARVVGPALLMKFPVCQNLRLRERSIAPSDGGSFGLLWSAELQVIEALVIELAAPLEVYGPVPGIERCLEADKGVHVEKSVSIPNDISRWADSRRSGLSFDRAQLRQRAGGFSRAFDLAR